MAEKGLFNWLKTLFIRVDLIPPEADELTAAILTGNANEAARILARGLNPDKPDELGRFPLHFASSKNKAAIIELLIKSGADIHLLDEDGNTALMKGAMEDAPEACMKLIHLGIDYFLQNNKEKTALDLAIDSGHQKVIDLFPQRLMELEIIIAKLRNQQAARYSNLADTPLGIEGAGAGGRVQKPDFHPKQKIKANKTKRTLPELELEYSRLEKMLKMNRD